MVLGDPKLAKVCFKNLVRVWTMVSRSWSGTIRSEICALTVLGMTVESVHQ